MNEQLSLFGAKKDCINYDISPTDEDLCIKYKAPINRTVDYCFGCPYYIPFYPGKPINFNMKGIHNDLFSRL